MPFSIKQPEPPSASGLKLRAAELRGELRLFLPEKLAERTGSQYLSLGTGSGEFHLPFFGSAVMGSFPEFRFFSAVGDELPEFQQLLLVYYFASADGTPLTGNYVSFADLPGGRMYSLAFQGYTGDDVVRNIGNDIDDFRTACETLGGLPVKIADATYQFSILPGVMTQIVYWLGDEDFPSSCKILFDAASIHYLPIDACAIVGSTLSRKVLNQYQKHKQAYP